MKTANPLLPAMAALGLAFALGVSAAGADPSAAPASPAAASAPAATASSVKIANYTFAPASLTVVAGTKVTFTNTDSTAHTVTSTDKTAGKPAFDSGDLAQNATWSHVFEKAGTYNFICTYHSSMKGTVVVK